MGEKTADIESNQEIEGEGRGEGRIMKDKECREGGRNIVQREMPKRMD